MDEKDAANRKWRLFDLFWEQSYRFCPASSNSLMSFFISGFILKSVLSCPVPRSNVLLSERLKSQVFSP